jgi:hypothetical protein
MRVNEMNGVRAKILRSFCSDPGPLTPARRDR